MIQSRDLLPTERVIRRKDTIFDLSPERSVIGWRNEAVLICCQRDAVEKLKKRSWIRNWTEKGDIWPWSGVEKDYENDIYRPLEPLQCPLFFLARSDRSTPTCSRSGSWLAASGSGQRQASGGRLLVASGSGPRSDYLMAGTKHDQSTNTNHNGLVWCMDETVYSQTKTQTIC